MSVISEIMGRFNDEQLKMDSKPTKAQATRLRAVALELRKACDASRKSTLDASKLIPVKPRASRLIPVAADDEELPPSPPVLERQDNVKVKRVRKPTVKALAAAAAVAE